jgi:mannosyltransferase OCH1-like enzyme
MIPKIIHQTWKTEIIPDNWKSSVESCKEIYSTYNYILWTDKSMEEFVKNEYPDFYNTYKSYKYNIQRCDAFRYLVLYKFGGIYLDLDIICKKSLDSLLHYDIVFTKSANTPSIYTNAFYMSIPQNPFIKYCIDNLEKNINSFSNAGKHLHVMNSTGPLFLSNMINNYKLENINNNYVLSKLEFSGDCYVCNLNTCNGGIYFSHVKGDSWHELDSTCYNFVMCNYKKIFTIIFIIILIIIFIIISTKKIYK